MKAHTTKTKNGKGYLEPGEAWHCPTTKVTIRIPTCAVKFMQPEAESKGATLAWICGIFVMQGLNDYVCALAEDRKEERKQKGYWKRSLRRYGIEPEED